jgi:hypothetical protein
VELVDGDRAQTRHHHVDVAALVDAAARPVHVGEPDVHVAQAGGEAAECGVDAPERVIPKGWGEAESEGPNRESHGIRSFLAGDGRPRNKMARSMAFGEYEVRMSHFGFHEVGFRRGRRRSTPWNG